MTSESHAWEIGPCTANGAAARVTDRLTEERERERRARVVKTKVLALFRKVEVALKKTVVP